MAVAAVRNLDALGDEPLATFLAAAAQQVAALFGGHAGAETELAPAAALGGLIGPFAHIRWFCLEIAEAVSPILGDKGP